MEGELFRIGPIAMYSYGCALAAAFLVGTALAVREGVRRGLDVMLIVNMAIRVVVVGLLAGRIGYCLPDGWFYITHPWEFFNVPQGGMSYVPALLACIAYIGWYTRQLRLPFWPLLDVFSPGLAIGLILGFLGAAEVQPVEGAFHLGSLYWPPPTLVFFTLEYMGLWYLATSRRRLAPGRRFCQIVAVDAAARMLSSIWAWALYAETLPHALSVVVGAALLAAAGGVSYRLELSPQEFRAGYHELAPACEQEADEALTRVQLKRPPRRKRLSVRERFVHSGLWFGIYIIFVLLLGRNVE